MDLICTRCGEPWDLDTVLHETPADFQRKGALITHCPTCPPGKPNLPAATATRLEIIREIARALGDDVDGFAATLEDFGLLND
jgi:hypothetical protein